MALRLKGRDFISLHDFTGEEIFKIFQVARELKELLREGKQCPLLAGKTLGMIFQKPSTRTRVSFEVGIFQLGGYGLFLNASDLQLRRGETIGDTARVLSRYVDGIMIRTFDHKDVEDLAKYATVPVINGLTDRLHPCQALADYFTILEKRGRLEGLKLAYVGDGNNVAHSLLFGAAKVGMNIAIATPEGYEPDSAIVDAARKDAKATGSRIDILHDPVEAVKDADVIYTDVWASMGQEQEHDRRVKALTPYQVNQELVDKAKPDVMVMHCLPAHRGEEITDDVIDGPHSIVFDQAENRMHAQKGLMALLMRD
ncbi:MAG TPA: ornithine carbamoyltransferase [Firmicutes bacterium]|nr:ornithine carbamoyltransferase [Bacillota bacterium]